MTSRLPLPSEETTRFHVFVPAIMSAGLVFSLFTVLRDAFAQMRNGSAGRAEQVAGHSTAAAVRTGAATRETLEHALRPRTFYALGALTLIGVAVEVLVGATANYFRAGGYVEGGATVWAIAVLVGGGLATAGGTCAALLVTWPHPPSWTRLALTRTFLGRRPDADEPDVARLVLGWMTLVAGAATVLLAMIVALSPHVVHGPDTEITESAAGWDWPEAVPLDLLGDTRIALVLALLVGLATLRCPVFALTYLGSVGVALGAYRLLKHAVGRPRPVDGPLTLAAESFPSGHLVQATLIAGLVPTAVALLTRRRAAGWWTAGPLAVALVATGLYRIHVGTHWASDVVAGVLLGASLVLGVHWVLRHPRWHAHCHKCLWVPHPDEPRHSGRGLVAMELPVVAAVRMTARVWTGAVLGTFGLLAVTIGIPRNPDGEGWLAEFEVPIQLAFLGLAALGWLVAFRWEAPGALLLGLAGTGLGVLAGVGHPPTVAVLLMMAFWSPAVAYWLVWQYRRSHRAIAVLALAMTASLLGGWMGAAQAYSHYFGPAHQQSSSLALPADRVEWVWSGGVGPTGFRVNARVHGRADRASLEVSAPGGTTPARVTPAIVVPDSGVVSWTVDGLASDTEYDYAVVVDGHRDRTRGLGSVRTYPLGAASFTVAVGACARTGSNGAVFDAIRAADPLLYIVDGDLHYGNVASDDPAAFRRMYDKVLTAPAQAALYREVPVAYIWDDHDYGPNDGAADSPSRSGATSAYRQVVPHAPLTVTEDDGGLYHAFTVGRVRFILTDTRSYRTATSMLGEEQTAWLERELVESARTHSLVVWVNPDPWIAPDEPGRDDWGGYATDRRRIATTIDEAGVDNLVMLAGDAHMAALDDGTNTGYGPSKRGFPLLHAGALDRPGSIKGGPYSDGAFPGAGQFGLLRVEDTGGDTIAVQLSGHTWDGEVLVSRTFRIG